MNLRSSEILKIALQKNSPRSASRETALLFDVEGMNYLQKVGVTPCCHCLSREMQYSARFRHPFLVFILDPKNAFNYKLEGNIHAKAKML